ncbi:hypothetical protein GALMADRAFT_1180248 [Galerina marginata CBS 339.88]|uniref:Uncharacterized protein n=1 Tax=Galerina marginata (strain CBS 339.88) TaxID=685588 RepID=A0A067TMC8_GALM3|nr:hypothetical protein GALMADRAFT_1180248 [Galerina marginata CBS 339.88]
MKFQTFHHFADRPHFLDCECECGHKRIQLQQAIKKRLLGISSVTRSFWTSKVGNRRTTDQQEVRYQEYHGIGHPNSTGRPYGQPGDIYIDLTPKRHQLYTKTLTLEWAVWPGPMIIMNGLRHPHNSNYILTCKLSDSSAGIGWHYKGIRQNFELSAHEIIATVLKIRANFDRPKKRTRAKTSDGDDSRRKMSKKRKNNADAVETNDPPRKTLRTACEKLGPTPSTLDTDATPESVAHTHCSTLTSGTLENAIRHTSPAHVASEIATSASDWNVPSTSRQDLRDSDTSTSMQDGHPEKVSQVASEPTGVATMEPNHAPPCLPVSQGPSEQTLEQIPEQLSCGTTDAIEECKYFSISASILLN